MKFTGKALIVTLIMLLFCANSVGAYNIGDVINCAQPTSIIASINGYQLMSYNVDGITIISFDDLSRFGQVSYSDEKRDKI